MLYEADITVIGAGIIGLAIAEKLATRDRPIYVLEKNDSFGKEISSRHSEVIHAGIYYPADSLKAKTCVEGNALLYELCQKCGIGHKNSGKLIVATDNSEIEELELLLKKGQENGVRELEILSKQKIEEIEPNIKAIAAIFSPSTGIIDSHSLMKYFIAIAEENGAKIVYKSQVINIDKLSDGYELTIRDSSGIFSFKTKILINCAGLHSDKIAEMVEIDAIKENYKLHYCKGEYFSVGNGKNKLVKKLIYPVIKPKSAGLGIHSTLDLEGRMRLGPNAYYVNELDYKVDASHKKAFYNSAKVFLPFIELSDLEPEMAGIRPKLQAYGENFRDFVIKHESDRGFPGFINLIGIESPGLTASPAIAKIVADMVKDIL